MEPEANIGDENLAESVTMRRRSASFSDDYSVQRTNDDASQSKLAAVQLNYYKDDFIKRFVNGEHVSHRDPEISIGYWARVAGVRHYVDQFLEKVGENAQIISLGSGFDTLFWRLKQEGKKIRRFVDVDFSSVTSKKIRLIRKPGTPSAVELFSEEPKEEQHADLHAGDYQLVGADIRQWEELKGKLDKAGVDFSLPTLVLAECVLVYMSVDHSQSLLSHLVDTFDTIAFLAYEQCNINDEFGRVMVDNLEKRGLQLPGLTVCENEATHQKRLKDAGFAHYRVQDMNAVYNTLLPKDEIKRVEAIEHLDEMELLRQLNAHYCFCYAVNDQTDKYTGKLF